MRLGREVRQMIKIGDYVTWQGDAVGGANTGLVIGIDNAALGTPVYMIRLKSGRCVRLPQRCCKKTDLRA